MELTGDEIWTKMTTAKALGAETGDRLVKSAIPLLAHALTRVDDPDEPVRLLSQEEAAAEGITAMEEAYFCLYGRAVTS